jgi:hypothetical protein
MEDPGEELPNYSPSPGHPRTGIRSLRREHRYALRDKNGRDWLSFQVKSRASNSKHTPLYLEGDTISGEVRLDLVKAETLKGITISVSGSLVPHRISPAASVHLTRVARTTRFARGRRPWDRRKRSFWTRRRRSGHPRRRKKARSSARTRTRSPSPSLETQRCPRPRKRRRNALRFRRRSLNAQALHTLTTNYA